MKHGKGLTWLTELPIAHRGLHDGNVERPENSMAAFRAAIAGPYAIECDLQPSGDGVPMVFHDDDLMRMTGRSGNIRERAAEDMRDLRLAQTVEPVPTLADLLAETRGSVPLILELKSQPGKNGGFAGAVCDLLKDYSGPVSVMSFDPALVADLRRAAPGLPRGLVVEGNWRRAIWMIRTVLSLNAHFVSYAIDDLPSPGPMFTRFCLGMPLICWTVRTEEQRRRARRWAGQITFEGFVP